MSRPEFEFDCLVCATRHEPCIDMAERIRKMELAASLNMNGAAMSPMSCNWANHILRIVGQVTITNTTSAPDKTYFDESEVWALAPAPEMSTHY